MKYFDVYRLKILLKVRCPVYCPGLLLYQMSYNERRPLHKNKAYDVVQQGILHDYLKGI